jgi:3-oxoacyl-[acyl-carrier protein] reductase
MSPVALVTGVSRQAGIGYAIVDRLTSQGTKVFLHHYQGYAAIPDVPHLEVDLSSPDGPADLMAAAVAEYGHIDVLICNHALTGHDGPLDAMTAEILDRHWAVNTRSTILLTQAFAAQHSGQNGRVVFLTSGQDLGPMPNEIAYAASKGALATIVRSLADTLADRSITVNAVNPGPTDTGWAAPDIHSLVEKHFPNGRWGTPDDAARLIAWLAGEDAVWITGQVISSEGGFRR